MKIHVKNLFNIYFSIAYSEKIPFVKPAPIDEQEAKKQKKGKKGDKQSTEAPKEP